MVYLGPAIEPAEPEKLGAEKPGRKCEQILLPLPVGDVAEDDIQVGHKATEAMCSTELIHLTWSVKALVENVISRDRGQAVVDVEKVDRLHAALDQARRTLQVVTNWPNDQRK